MPRKLLIIYNSESSRYELVQKEVIEPARNLAGWMVGKYVVTAEGFEEDLAKLMRVLSDGDLVVAAGGDGTATMVANCIMRSEKDVTLGVLGYGNFNDLAKTLKTRRARWKGDRIEGGIAEVTEAFKAGKVREIWPLDVRVNGKHWRYAICYLTLGLFAESTEVFDKAEVRKQLQQGRRSLIFSWWNLVKWYFANRHQRVFLPEFTLNGQKMSTDVTDYLAVNGPHIAGMMRGGNWYLQPKEFASGVGRLSNFWRLSALMLKSILRQVPVASTEGDVLEFVQPGSVEAQAEGEYQKLENVKKIEVRKAEKALKVIKL